MGYRSIANGHFLRDLQRSGRQWYAPIQRNDEDALTRAIVTLDEVRTLRLPADHGAVAECGVAGGKDRVQWIWRRERLKVPAQQRPRGRLWLEDAARALISGNHKQEADRAC